MEQYIPKSALLAEIEKRISRNKKRKKWEDIPEKRHQLIIEGQLLGELKHFLDSLEVKEVDLEKDVRQILSLYYKGIKHYDDIIEKEREENGGSDFAIKIMDGVVDARELGIQYVIDKLKAQKGEIV